MMGTVRGHPSKTSGPMGGGQPKVVDHGRREGGSAKYRTSTNGKKSGKKVV